MSCEIRRGEQRREEKSDGEGMRAGHRRPAVRAVRVAGRGGCPGPPRLTASGPRSRRWRHGPAPPSRRRSRPRSAPRRHLLLGRLRESRTRRGLEPRACLAAGGIALGDIGFRACLASCELPAAHRPHVAQERRAQLVVVLVVVRDPVTDHRLRHRRARTSIVTSASAAGVVSPHGFPRRPAFRIALPYDLENRAALAARQLSRLAGSLRVTNRAWQEKIPRHRSRTPGAGPAGRRRSSSHRPARGTGAHCPPPPA